LNRPTVIALIGLAVAAVALVLALTHLREEATPEVVAPVPPAGQTAAQTAATERKDPTFDVVRIDAEGDSVIAGRAMPGANVTIIDGTTELGRVTADARGEWVFVPSVALAPGSRELKLVAQNPDGSIVESTEPVVLVVPERGKGPALAVKAGKGGASTVLQGPAGDGGILSLDVVDHTSETDRLFVGGRAPAGSLVFLYVDNRFVGRTDTDGDGRWRIAATKPAAGKHQLRADLIGDKGKVLARVEVTWSPGEELIKGGASIVVAPGNSLWRIARKLYGKGIAYTAIFEANRDHIRDPNLIYPGQVFSAPAR
jgi:nucleoid-associated protein YgaU